MATARLVPSIITNSAGESYLEITDAENAFTNTDSDTYATIKNISASTSNRYFRLSGFNFNAVPSDATINSFTIKLKAKETGANTVPTYASPTLRTADNTGIDGDCDSIVNLAVYQFTNVTKPFSYFALLGDSFTIRMNCRRSSANTAAYYYIYGAEILVDYTAQGGSDKLYVKENGAWEETVPYKKVNGSWELQVDVTNVFDDTKQYIKGN